MNNHTPLLHNYQGIRLLNGTRVLDRGGNAYPQEMCGQGIAMFQSGGEAALNLHHLVPLRHQKKSPSFNTCMRWVRQHQIDGHFQPKRPISNHRVEREIKGQDLFNLALFRAVRPKAYIDKVCTFVHNRNPANDPYQVLVIPSRLC
jgi:hypothetical protein